MGMRWRRAFCTSIPHEDEAEKQMNTSPPSRGRLRLGFFSNPSTPRLPTQPVISPRLHCRTSVAAAAAAAVQGSPKLQCKIAPAIKSAPVVSGSNPSSPRSPGPFALFRSPRLRVSRSSCGICAQRVKAGHGTAIFTAECSHGFHFSCIAAHVKKQGGLICPVCNAGWTDVPLFGVYHQENDCGMREESKSDKPKSAEISARSAAEARMYDDDEPLFSPRFNPIPEADEDTGEEETGEFRGFFVNESSSSSRPGELTAVQGLTLAVDAKLLPEAVILSVGRSYESYVATLRIKAPAPSTEHGSTDVTGRAPVDLVTVLDVSGSMTGTKLQMLKSAMRMVVASLGPHDRLSIVAFSGSARRLLPLRRMTPAAQRVTRQIVERLACGNGTCVGEALKKASKILDDRRDRNPVASIMLLSDGQGDGVDRKSAGQPRPPPCAASTRFAHLEIPPIQAYGFGGDTGIPGQDAFSKSIGGLLSVVVQDLRIHTGFSPGEISGVYSSTGRPSLLASATNAGSIGLGDMYAEEERELLLELRVPKAAIGVHHVLSVSFSYRDPRTQRLVRCHERPLLVPRPRAVRSSDPKIERLRNVFITTRAVAEAARQAEQHDFSAAHHLLSSARSLLLRTSTISIDDHIRCLEAEMADLQIRRDHHHQPHLTHERSRDRRQSADGYAEPTTPTSAWRAAEQLAKVAIMRKSMNRVGDLHGFENARF